MRRFVAGAGQALFQHGTIETGIMRDEEVDTVYDSGNHVVVDLLSDQVGIGDPGETGDLFGQGDARILPPVPALSDLDDDTVLIVTEPAHREFDDGIVLMIQSRRFDVNHERRDQVTIKVADPGQPRLKVDAIEDALIICRYVSVFNSQCGHLVIPFLQFVLKLPDQAMPLATNR